MGEGPPHRHSNGSGTAQATGGCLHQHSPLGAPFLSAHYSCRSPRGRPASPVHHCGDSERWHETLVAHQQMQPLKPPSSYGIERHIAPNPGERLVCSPERTGRRQGGRTEPWGRGRKRANQCTEPTRQRGDPRFFVPRRSILCLSPTLSAWGSHVHSPEHTGRIREEAGFSLGFTWTGRKRLKRGSQVGGTLRSRPAPGTPRETPSEALLPGRLGPRPLSCPRSRGGDVVVSDHRPGLRALSPKLAGAGRQGPAAQGAPSHRRAVGRGLRGLVLGPTLPRLVCRAAGGVAGGGRRGGFRPARLCTAGDLEPEGSPWAPPSQEEW